MFMKFDLEKKSEKSIFLKSMSLSMLLHLEIDCYFKLKRYKNLTTKELSKALLIYA